MAYPEIVDIFLLTLYYSGIKYSVRILEKSMFGLVVGKIFRSSTIISFHFKSLKKRFVLIFIL